MAVTAIGDIHGRSDWKRIVENSRTENVVFIGDYFDSRDISAEEQANNFAEILKFQEETSRKVTLLIGNHDYHYLPGVLTQSGGFNKNYISRFRDLLIPALRDGCIQFSKEIDKVLYTHAGVTNTWLKDSGYRYDISIEDFINGLFDSDKRVFELREGNMFGNDTFQSPLFIRSISLEEDPVMQKQVVGHTPKDKVTFSKSGLIAYIDTLGTSGNYLTVRDGMFRNIFWELMKFYKRNLHRQQ